MEQLEKALFDLYIQRVTADDGEDRDVYMQFIGQVEGILDASAIALNVDRTELELNWKQKLIASGKTITV